MLLVTCYHRGRMAVVEPTLFVNLDRRFLNCHLS